MRFVVIFCLMLMVASTSAYCADWVEVSKGSYYDKSSIDSIGKKVSVKVKMDATDVFQSTRGQKASYFLINLVLNCQTMTYRELGSGAIDTNGKPMGVISGKNTENEILGSPYVDIGKKVCTKDDARKSPSQKKKK
ncbi:hypothetical protein [Solidesulfovibrio sp.]|uniref:hypothetical protein n=1 Tax=Solidesulfovibrio sp. TaxID=2910990 RepID=UPI0026139A8F|nr:hypothetical protein [Solidesulfovibrio sp.]